MQHNFQLERNIEAEKYVQLSKEFESFRQTSDTSDRERQLSDKISNLENVNKINKKCLFFFLKTLQKNSEEKEIEIEKIKTSHQQEMQKMREKVEKERDALKEENDKIK